MPLASSASHGAHGVEEQYTLLAYPPHRILRRVGKWKVATTATEKRTDESFCLLFRQHAGCVKVQVQQFVDIDVRRLEMIWGLWRKIWWHIGVQVPWELFWGSGEEVQGGPV